MIRNKNGKFVLTIGADIDQVISSVGEIEKVLNALDNSAFKKGGLEKLKEVQGIIKSIIDTSKTPAPTRGTFTSLERQTSSLTDALKELFGFVSELEDLGEEAKLDFLPADEQKRIKQATKAAQEFVAIQQKRITATQKLAAAQARVQEAQRKVQEARQQDDPAVKSARINLETAKTQKKSIEGRLTQAKQSGKTQQEIDTLIKELEAAKAKLVEATVALQQAEEASAAAAAEKELTRARRQETSATTALKKIKSIETAYADLYKVVKQLGALPDGVKETYSPEDAERLKSALEGIRVDGLEAAGEAIERTQSTMSSTTQTFKDAQDATKELSGSIDRNKDAWIEHDKQLRQSNAMVERIRHFVGLSGAATLARRAIQNAMRTIKELDATMTEMSVVTDLGVGDYWKQLPEYTDRANELGVAVKDAYESATLYYQQGLKTEEVIALSTETLKMGKIAGLDAADATNKMTAALRGFNLELNQTNAQRVSDVYSELAAITASDVNEISSAMTKTASIASNAGMALETTAAFLSQIIETTRESAETAGTALTISA